MAHIPEEKIVLRGICLYDGVAEYEIVVVEHDILYGSGDYEDSPEIADDQAITCYYSWCDTPNNRGVFSAGQGVFLSIEEAKAQAESLGPVTWSK